MKNDLTPALKGAQRTAENKTQRLKQAATLSQSKMASEICQELNISKRTLKRYMADPLWQESGGIQLTLIERGRPTRNALSESEKRTLAEAYALHNQGLMWVEVAAELEMTIRQLEYLREKDTETREPDPLTAAEREILQRADQLRDAGMKWKEIPTELGISHNQLRYLRRKGETTDTT